MAVPGEDAGMNCQESTMEAVNTFPNVRIALRLRKETTMTLSRIAQRLRMGTKTRLSHLLYWHNKKK